MQDQESNAAGAWSDEKKKKYLKWGLIGGLLLIALTLAIVLPLTLGGKNNPDNPTPTPDPPFSTGVNYYMLGDVLTTRFQMSGVLTYNETALSQAQI